MPHHPHHIKVDLRQVVYALSDALDLVGIDDVAHGKRVGIMAAACGRELGWRPAECSFMFNLGLLHDIGVSSTNTHHHLVNEFDWLYSQTHCETGYRLLKDFQPLAAMAEPVHFHHTHWEQLAGRPDVALETKLRANLIYLVDRVDALTAPYYATNTMLLHGGEIRDKIREATPVYFSPELTAAFLAVSEAEAFWLQLEPRGIQASLQDMLTRGHPHEASLGEVRQLAEIFARIVDAKSPFTAAHSLGVARLAKHFAQAMGLGDVICEKLEIAGLLHDLGKLRIPDEVLDKPGKLDAQERQIINTHSFETFQILSRIQGFEEIARWASYHHEEPDGSGYPFHLKLAAMSLEARILRVADIFQAMVQDRPYRQGLSAPEALDFLQALVTQGRVDGAVVAVAARDLPGAMAAALA